VTERKTRRSALVIGLVITVFSLFFLSGTLDFLNALELESLAFRQREFSKHFKSDTNNTVNSPITIVTFDRATSTSDSFNRLFGKPISRSASAYMVRFFKRATPKTVVFDMSYNGGKRYHDLSGDHDLAESLQGTRNIASTLIFNEAADPELSFKALKPDTRRALKKNSVQVYGIERFSRKFYHFPSLVPPYAELFEKTPMRFYSALSSIPDANSNGIIQDRTGDSRRWSAFSRFGNLVFPTLALGTLLGEEKTLNLSPEGRLSWKNGSVDLGSDGMPLIKWYGHGIDRKIYPEVSFWDVVLSEIVLECRENPALPVCEKPWLKLPKEPLVQPAQFNNQYVLVGFTVHNAADEHKTIYGTNYHGVYIFANILDNLLRKDFVYPAPAWANWLALLVLPLLMGIGIMRYPSVLAGSLLAVTLGLGYLVLCIYAYSNWNLWLVAVNPLLALMACFTGGYLYRFVHERQKRLQLRFAFGKYVSPAVMQIVERHPEKVTLGGERREMSFLFCDIRGFTTYSDNNPPEAVQTMLTQYFSVMNRIILHDYHGSINKLIGDAIMAYWGFPLENEDHAFMAVSAAMAMRDAIREWRQDPTKPPINIGIGINTGEAMIGNVGSVDFMDFTVIGDAVNVASRLESANKEYGTNIIISATTYEKVKDRIRARSLGEAAIRGKEGRTEIYEPLEFL
jgi:class 3 adenylate cyclase/CHASE2 domain-containing sensor protein